VRKYLKYSVTGTWWLVGQQGVQTEKQNETEQERNMLRRRQKRWCRLGGMTRSSLITCLGGGEVGFLWLSTSVGTVSCCYM